MSNLSAFGYWLRQQRKEYDMSQEDLAERVGCAYETIRKIEVGSRRPSKQMAELLGKTFGIPAAELPAFIEFARQDPNAPGTGSDAPGPAALANQPAREKQSYLGTLPAQRTSFVGRKSEIEGIRALLLSSHVRVLTLTGAPGTGKTRLALKVASSVQAEFSDGVYFVGLASVSDPDKVPGVIARALNIKDEPSRPALALVQEQLRERVVLLLLDNFEHLTWAGSYVGELVEACPNIKILTTSRTPLNIYGEYQFFIRPMDLPGTGEQLGAEELYQYESAALFVQRARSVNPEFRLTAGNAAAVADICRQLDGLPLAIELAAAYCKILPPHAIRQKLTSRLNLLTLGASDLPRRQQTLRGAISWSHDLLSAQQEALFRRVSVFVGGWTLEAVEGVCNLPDEADVGTIQGVVALLDRSLLEREDGAGGQPRFSMLQTIREYAQEQLNKSSEVQLMQRQHARYFLAFAESAEPHLKGPERDLWLQRLELEHDNFRTALTWCMHTPEAADLGLRLAGALHWFWYFRGYLPEGREWLEGALARAGDLRHSAAGAKALDAAGHLALLQDDYSVMLDHLAESVSTWRSVGDKQGLAYALADYGIATVYRYRGNSVDGSEALKEAIQLFREVGDRWGLALALNWLGDATGLLRHPEDAVVAYKSESLDLYRQLDDKWGIAFQLSELGRLAVWQGNYELARARLEESLRTGGFGDKWSVAHVLRSLGDIALFQHDRAQAVLLYEESLALYRELGDKFRSSTCLRNLAGISLSEGETERAAQLYQESLQLAFALQNVPNVALCLAGMAGVALMKGCVERAATLFGMSDALREASQGMLPPADLLVYRRYYDLTRERLGEEAFDRSWKTGQLASLDKAVIYARSEANAPELDTPAPAR